MPSQSLGDLLASVHSGQIVLPEFQRDLAWKPSDVIKLIGSVMHGFPIGSLLLMKSDGSYGARAIQGAPPQSGDSTDKTLVLDGQQRLTSLYRVFYGNLDAEDALGGRFYLDYGELRQRKADTLAEIASEIEQFIVFKRAKEVNAKYPTAAEEMALDFFPLDIIFREHRSSYTNWFNAYNFARANGQQKIYEDLSNFQSTLNKRFIERVIGYQIQYEEIAKNASPDVICTIFETINTTGKRLTVFDLLVAKCFRIKFRLRDKLEEYLTEASVARAFESFEEGIVQTWLPKVIGLLAVKDVRKGELLKLRPELIEKYWKKSCTGLSRALDFLVDQVGCIKPSLLPYEDCVPVLAALFADRIGEEPSDSMLERLRRWYWCVTFGGYFVGAPDTKVVRSYRELGDESGYLFNPNVIPSAVKDCRIDREMLDSVNKPSSAVYRGVLSLIASTSPPDFAKHGRTISSDNVSTEDHHIYPLRSLASYKIGAAKANLIANRVLIEASTNGMIGMDLPHIYINSHKFAQYHVERHLIPLDVLRIPFAPEVYERFLAERATLILSRISDVTGIPLSASSESGG